MTNFNDTGTDEYILKLMKERGISPTKANVVSVRQMMDKTANNAGDAGDANDAYINDIMKQNSNSEPDSDDVKGGQIVISGEQAQKLMTIVSSLPEQIQQEIMSIIQEQ
jgi:hypothetical protein